MTCTFPGEQSVANAECSAYSLACQVLGKADTLNIGWDHLNAIRLLHERLPATAPGGHQQAHSTGGQPADTNTPSTKAHYEHNPHFLRALALTRYPW